MQLSLQNFSTLVEGMAASVQGAAQSLLDLTVGSVLRALLEANASVALWIQWLIVQTLATTRLATSSGPDCDSFGADFGFSRLPAVSAAGSVTFSRFTPTIAAFIPVGTVVTTVDKSQSFLVVSSSTNPAFSSSLNGYSLGSGISSISVPVVAEIAGSFGNVQSGAISVISSALPGIDAVTNGLTLSGGIDAESDTAFRARFGNYLASLSRATIISIGSAISGIEQGLSYTIEENVNQAGLTQMGNFVVTVDDGSGSPSIGLLSVVQETVDPIRPVGTSFSVQGPIVSLANVSVTLVTSPSASHASAVAAVANALEAYIASLPVGATLSYTKLVQIAYGASGDIMNVTGLLLNGGTSDLVPVMFGVVRSGTMAVS